MKTAWVRSLDGFSQEVNHFSIRAAIVEEYALFRIFWSHRALILKLTKREILMRYKGSLLGILWSFITPLCMLAIYTFVFGMIFQSRWSAETDSKLEFAFILFCALTTFQIFSETVARAPGLITGNPNYIKKIVFPVEILPICVLGAVLVNAFISFGLLFVALAAVGSAHWAALILVPLLLVPLMFLSLGLSWFLASLGVYIRDIAQIMPVVIAALMFLSPIFYPISAVPEYLQKYYQLNPLSAVVEEVRKAMIWDQMPDWRTFMYITAVSLLVAFAGFFFFQRTKKGFVDVI